MPVHEMTASIVFTYYRDLGRAADFYVRVMGLEVVVDQGYAKILQLTPRSFLGLVDSEKGTLRASDTKSVIIATVTGEVDRWYAHLVAHGVEILKPLATHPGLGIRGFMAVGPEGYVLEFEEFLETERNAQLLTVLRQVRG